MEDESSSLPDGSSESPILSPPHRTHTQDSGSSHGSEFVNHEPHTVHRRRRVPGAITLNACTNCKKARAKCDGVKPACKRCAARHVNDSCHYVVHARTAKDQMMREIHRLQQEKEDLQEQTHNLSEENSWIVQIILSLRDDRHCVEILHRLKRGESHASIVAWLGRPFAQEEDLSPVSELRLSDAIEAYHRDLVDNKDPRYWTSVTTDVTLIEHLLNLYLTWVHPVHMLFDEAYFTSSFQACTDTYCSAALVNAICAMSCHLLHNTWGDDEKAREIIVSLRARFLNEAQILLKGVDNNKMTSIQSYAIMFLIELSLGNGLMATSHLRLAIEALTAKANFEQSSESFAITLWGTVTLQTAWSGFTFVKPSAPISPKAKVFQGIEFDTDGHWQRSIPRNRPDYAALTASESAKLYRIIHETILLYCGGTGRASARQLLKVYERFLSWKEELPTQISQTENDSNVSPHVLFLHIQYYTALVQLFQPLLFLEQTPRPDLEAINDLLFKHAKSGLSLFIAYRKRYSAVYRSPFQLFCLVHICDAIVTHNTHHGEDIPATIRFCIESLEDAKFGYPIAGPLQRMFANILTEHDIPLAADLAHLVGPSYKYQLEDLLNACSRSSYRPPIAQLLLNFEETLAQDFMAEWQAACDQQAHRGLEDPKTVYTQRMMHIDSLLN